MSEKKYTEIIKVETPISDLISEKEILENELVNITTRINEIEQKINKAK